MAYGESNATVGAGSTTVSKTSIKVLNASDREYAAFINDSGTAGEDIYLGFGVDAVKNKGIYIKNGGGSFEITQDNKWVGDVYAIGTTVNLNLCIVEW